MRLFDLIASKTGADETLSGCVRYTVLDGKKAFFQNVKSISEYAPERLILCAKGCCLVVSGEKLSLVSYCDGDLVVAGNICAVERCAP